jgi:hypothetical protein
MSETQGGSGGSDDWFAPASAIDISTSNDEELDAGGSRKRSHEHGQATNAESPQTKKQKALVEGHERQEQAGVEDMLKAQTTRRKPNHLMKTLHN